MNLNGAWDNGGSAREANFLPFKDYTGYAPMNSVTNFGDPERWQPGLDILRTGIYAAQQFLTPQMRLVTPFTFEDVTQFSIDPHSRIAVKVGMKALCGDAAHIFLSRANTVSHFAKIWLIFRAIFGSLKK